MAPACSGCSCQSTASSASCPCGCCSWFMSLQGATPQQGKEGVWQRVVSLLLAGCRPGDCDLCCQFAEAQLNGAKANIVYSTHDRTVDTAHLMTCCIPCSWLSICCTTCLTTSSCSQQKARQAQHTPDLRTSKLNHASLDIAYVEDWQFAICCQHLLYQSGGPPCEFSHGAA
jgi:hypothetical protein